MMNLKTLKHKIGQRLIVGFQGERFDESYQSLALEWNIGGYILFRRNLKTIDSCITLIQSIKDFHQNHQLTPPWISVDEEGGKVRRLPLPFTTIAPMENLGKKADPKLALSIGQVLGKELQVLGFNLNFSPVLDVNSNPDNPVIASRAISHDPLEIPALAIPLLDGLKEYGVMGCGKHFPGHGDTKEDSHHQFAFCYHQANELEKIELYPFAQLITASKLDLIMTAHVKYPAIDPDFPATLSEKWIKGYLRDKLNYQGLVITDDLEMLGIEKLFSQQEIARIGLKIGIDLFLVCHQLEKQKAILEAILQEVQQGRYTISDLDQRHTLILATKSKYQVNQDKRFSIAQINALLGNEKHLEIAKSMEVLKLGAQNQSV
jgi:beta-N-acetylhexosaminidase